MITIAMKKSDVEFVPLATTVSSMIEIQFSPRITREVCRNAHPKVSKRIPSMSSSPKSCTARTEKVKMKTKKRQPTAQMRPNLRPEVLGEIWSSVRNAMRASLKYFGPTL